MRKKVARRRRVGKELRLLEGEVAFVGVDVHKKSYSVSVWTDQREWVAEWSQPADPKSLCRRLEPIRSQIALVVYEAGPTGYGLVRALRASGFPAEVIAPSKVHVRPGRSNKSDRLDAHELARLAAKGMLHSIYVPTPQEEADRQVVRRRNQLSRERRRTKHRIHGFLLQHGIPEPENLCGWSRRAVDALREIELREELRFALDTLLDDLEHFDRQVDAGNRKLDELAHTDRHATPCALMETVPGVGTITAMTYGTEVLQPRRFHTAAEVGSFTGLAPWVRRSGTVTRRGPIVKTGNRELRCMLVEAAWRWVDRDPRAKTLYGHLVAETASSQKAIVAVARHLAIVLWRILTTGQPYTSILRPDHEGDEPVAEA